MLNYYYWLCSMCTMTDSCYNIHMNAVIDSSAELSKWDGMENR